MNRLLSTVREMDLIGKGLLPYYTIALSYILVLFSYPMPLSPGIIEVIMGLGLIIGCLHILKELKRKGLGSSKGIVLSLGAGALLVLYPSIHGVARGLSINQIIRDLLPMAFVVVLVPLISYTVKNELSEKVHGILLASILVVGAISPLVFFVDMRSEFGSMGGLSSAFDETYSKPENIQIPDSSQLEASSPSKLNENHPLNTFSVRALHMFEPAVIFAAIYCGCLLVAGAMERKYIQMVLCAVVVATALYGFAMLRLRAPVGLFGLSVLIFIIYMTFQSNNAKERFVITAVMIGTSVLGVIVFKDIWWGLIEKTLLVGSNGKLEEWGAVFQVMREDVSNLFFGIGWGAEFVPDYQPYPVRYTHSLISFILLKSGLLGLVLLVLVYGRLFYKQFLQSRKARLEYKELAIYLAGGAVLIIGLLFQPTYKMLGFSIIVSMVLIMRTPFSGRQAGHTTLRG